MPRIAAAVAAVAAAGLALAGCSSGAASPSASSTKHEHVDLSLWTFIDPNAANDPRAAALKDVVDSYNKQSDDITVTVRSINYATIDSEVIKATASGTGPDIVNIYSNQLPMHVAAGTIQPMTKYVKPFLKAQGKNYIFPIAGTTFDGDIMSLPWETRAWLLWYRADLLEKAGLKPPATLAELGTTAAALQKTGVTGLGIGFSSQGLGADFAEKFIPLTLGNGGRILDKDGNAAFDSKAGAQALEYLKSLKDEGALTESALNMTADDVVNGVKAGTVAMAIEGSFRVSAARAGEGVGDNLKTMPIPSAKAGTPTDTPVSGQTLGIGANTKHADAAWDFIKYYVSETSQEKFAAAGVLPVLAKAYDSAAVKALPNYKELLSWRDYVLEHGTPNPATANYNQLTDALVTAGQKAVFQGASPSAVLKEAAQTFDSSH
jgi:multiple sugar transport system substrate-binding protein